MWFQGNPLILLFPNSSERILAESTHTIRWNTEGSGIDAVLIEVSADRGQTWQSSVGQPRYNLDSGLSDPNDDIIDARDLMVLADYWLARRQ